MKPGKHGSGIGVGRRAFTLVEVLVALAILAVLMPPIMYGLSLESRMAATARHRTEAASLGRQKIDEITAAYAVSGLGDSSGNFDPPYQNYTWTAAIQPFDSNTVDNQNTFLQELDVTVTWQESGEERNLALSTLIYQNNAATGAPSGGLTGGSKVGG